MIKLFPKYSILFWYMIIQEETSIVYNKFLLYILRSSTYVIKWINSQDMMRYVFLHILWIFVIAYSFFRSKFQYKCTKIVTYNTVITGNFVIKCINFRFIEEMYFFWKIKCDNFNFYALMRKCPILFRMMLGIETFPNQSIVRMVRIHHFTDTYSL